MGDVNGREPATEPNQQTLIRPVATDGTEINRELRPARQTEREDRNREEKKDEIENEEAEDYLDEMSREIEEREKTEPNAEDEGLSQEKESEGEEGRNTVGIGETMRVTRE